MLILLLAIAFKADVSLYMLIFIAAAFFLKGVIFLFDIGSVFDVTAAVLLIFFIFLNIPAMILIIVEILIDAKGLMGLAA